MKLKHSVLLAQILLLIIAAASSHSFAVTRGIEVIDKQGKPLSFYTDYHALVIGIGDYEKWPKLPGATKDAEEVAAKLKGLNCQVKLVLNPSAAELRSALNEMVYDLGAEPERGILFYFAGHGETESLADRTKMGYIVPRDCPLLKKDPKGFASHAVSMRDIESVSLRIKSKHVLMLFDSCFSGALFSLVRGVPHDITEKSALPVRQYITAGREDEQVPDRSMFKRCFLLGLEGEADLTGDGYVTGSEMGMYLSDKVVNYSNGTQHPQFGKINNPDLDRGDFIFVIPEIGQKTPKIETAPSAQGAWPAGGQPHQVASIPSSLKSHRINTVKKLRSKPVELSESDLNKMVLRHNFYVRHKNEEGDFLRDLRDNGDGTITDSVTGLTWQKSGSPSGLDIHGVKKYVDRLNAEKVGGHSDWRIPTLEELCSLLRRPMGKNDFVDGLFDQKQKICWSSDWLPPSPLDPSNVVAYHAVDLESGTVSQGGTGEGRLLQRGRDFYFIRVVRTERP